MSESTSFKDCVAKLTKDQVESLAEDFEVSVSTVKRWASGNSVPAKLIQKQVFHYIDLWFFKVIPENSIII